MNRELFDNLTVQEQLEFVNGELKKDKSLTQIAKSLNMSRSTFKRRFEKINYKYDDELKLYVKSDIVTIVTPVTQNESVTSITSVTDNTSNTGVTIPKNTINEIMEMLEWYREQKNIKEAEIIELPISEELKGNIVTRSFKIYENVLEKYNQFCEENPRLKKQDIINMAIIEYIRNFNK